MFKKFGKRKLFNQFMFDNEYYCEECFNEKFFVCNDCGEICLRDDSYTTVSNSVICDTCYSDNYFSLDEDYFNLAKDLGINLLGLREQVIKTSAFLIKSLKTLT
jgi:hypothetical protein